jgi:hypothetical protein
MISGQHAYDEAVRLRRSDAADRDELSRAEQAGPQPGFGEVCTTTHVGTYPTTAGAWYYVIPKAISGTETEGGSASSNAGTSKYLAWNIGASIPPEGTNVFVEHVPYRAVFRYG